MTGNPLQDAIATTAGDNQAPPPALLPYQQAWVADDAPLKVGEKSRRIGLTWAEAADDVLIAAREGGSNVFYISATQDMGMEYIEACAMWAKAFDMAAGEIEDTIFKDGDKEIQAYRIVFPKSGHRIVALSSSPRNLRGKQGVIVIDEAAFHENLDQMLKAAMAMLMWGDKVRIISTHDGADNPFAELIEQIRAGKRKGSVHRMTFDDAVAQGLYRRVCIRRGIEWTAEGEAAWVADVRNYYGDDAAEELDVIPSQGGGRYLALSLIEARMDPTTPIVRGKWPPQFAFEAEHVRQRAVEAWCEEELLGVLQGLNADLNHSFGEDFARVGDLTVLEVLEEGRDLVNRCRLQVELSQCPYKAQEQIVCYVIDRLPRFRAAAFDAGGNGGFLAEAAAQKYGSTRVAQIQLSDKFYLENMPRFRAAFEDGTLDAIPRDRETRDDLRSIEKINGTPKLPKAKTQRGDGPKLQRHGDAAIALFMAHYAATTMEPAPIEFQSTGHRRSGHVDVHGEQALAGQAQQIDRGFGAVRGKNDLGGFQ